MHIELVQFSIGSLDQTYSTGSTCSADCIDSICSACSIFLTVPICSGYIDSQLNWINESIQVMDLVDLIMNLMQICFQPNLGLILDFFSRLSGKAQMK